MKDDSALLLRQLLQLWQKMERMEQTHCAGFGLSVLQSRLLTYLKATEATPTAPSQIAAHFKLTKATVSMSLSSLKAKGLIHENRQPEDGRKKQIRLSPRGNEIVQRLEAYLLPVATLFDQTTKAQKQQLSNSLQTLLAKLSG